MDTENVVIGDFGGEAVQPEGFVIDCPGKADWAVQKIKEERQRRDIFVAAAKERISEMAARIIAAEEACAARTDFLLGALDRYLDTAPAKKSKTQYSLELPAGKLVRKLDSRAMNPDGDKLLAYCRAHSPTFIKTHEAVALGEFKKNLEIVGDVVVNHLTGEVVDAIAVVDVPGSFDIK